MRYQVIVAYDGSNYYGWQRQIAKKSIQEEIETILNKIMDCEIEIVASGRTDKGVHALGQVFHFDAPKNIACEKLQYAMNNYLPHDIRIQCIQVVDEAFHARFSVKKKTYQYIFSYDILNPFDFYHKTFLKQEVDIVLMQQAAAVFEGTHDFTSFASAKIDERKSCVRTIYKVSVEKKAQDIILTFVGNGFLRYMVRMLSQVIVEVGKKNITVSQVKMMLEKKDKTISRYKAPANGLYLVSVDYKEEI